LDFHRKRYGFITGILLLIIGLPLQAEENKEQTTEQATIRAEVCSGCHLEQYEFMKSSRHWVVGDERTAVNLTECSTCHGEVEEHVLSAGTKTEEGLTAFSPKLTTMTVPEQNAVCQTCHKNENFVHWNVGSHAAEDVGCVGCHRMHEHDKVLSKATQPDVCYTCHTTVRLQSNKPYGHPIREQKMACTDCHGPHGGPGDADMKAFTINETCYTCHAEKRGPFLWEHMPASEDCTLCHSAHGSIHAGMLERRQPQLCQSCHEPIADPGVSAGPHARHSRLALSYREPGGVDIGPDPPPGHTGAGRGISRFVMGEACMNCHTKVHGTNHPSGAKLMR
jgi:DmsE family decaheme c-type cytochrome